MLKECPRNNDDCYYDDNNSLLFFASMYKYAEFFDGNVPKDPIHKTIEIDQRKYMITQVSCIENCMIEVSAKKVDWKKEMMVD